MQYVLQQCVLVEHVWARCQHVRLARNTLILLPAKKYVAVSPKGASLKLTQNHTCNTHPHAHAHSGSWNPLWLSWKLRSPALTTSPPPDYPSWQAVNFGPSACDPMAGSRGQFLEVEQTLQEQKGGWVRRWEQTGFQMERRWASSPHLCGFSGHPLPASPHPLPWPVNVEVAAVFPHHRLWSASSVPGGLTSIMHLGPQTHAHSTHREHRVQKWGQWSKIHWALPCAAHAWVRWCCIMLL